MRALQQPGFFAVLAEQNYRGFGLSVQRPASLFTREGREKAAAEKMPAVILVVYAFALFDRLQMPAIFVFLTVSIVLINSLLDFFEK